MPAELQASRQDACLILTISNSGAGNMLHPDIYAAAIETLSTAERDDSVRTVILTGAGNTFCSGSARLTESGGRSDSLDALTALQGWIESILDCPKPVISAVEGMAAGAGFALALASDFIVAGNSAQFSMPSIKSSLTPDTGSWFLAHALPRQMAAELLFGGKPVPAPRLHQMGVINRLANDGEALNTALAWAEEISTLSPDIIERIKGMLREARMQPLNHYMEIEQQNFMECLHWRQSPAIS
jgi:enoyl-CoA hydratase/carnithine racemase